MTDGLSALFWGIITFSILVLIHEGGHFVAARVFGVKVHEFMIGLPGPAIRFHAKQTTYGITAIPLGGYVRIAGMEPGPENPRLGPALAAATRHGTIDANTLALDLGIDLSAADEALLTLADWDAIEPVADADGVYRSRYEASRASEPEALLNDARQHTYRALSTWQRVIVLSAGVVTNLVTAILVFTIVLSTFGYMKETGRLAEVGEGSAAAKAGIVAGDRIVRIGAKDIETWPDVTAAVQSYQPGDTVTVVVTRDGKRVTLTATLGSRPGTNQALLGVTPELEPTRPSVLEALLLSFSYIGMTFVAIAGFFNPQTFEASVSGASSVIGASYFAAEAARAGALDYAGLVAVLSLSLGAINIIPIPPLDGGKIAIELFERLRGRPLSRRVSLSLSAAGAALLFALIAYLMYSDVVRYIVR